MSQDQKRLSSGALKGEWKTTPLPPVNPIRLGDFVTWGEYSGQFIERIYDGESDRAKIIVDNPRPFGIRLEMWVPFMELVFEKAGS